MNNINFVEWDAKHKQSLIRLAGDAASQEKRLALMLAAEEMYKACKFVSYMWREKTSIHKAERDKAKELIELVLAKVEGG